MNISLKFKWLFGIVFSSIGILAFITSCIPLILEIYNEGTSTKILPRKTPLNTCPGNHSFDKHIEPLTIKTYLTTTYLAFSKNKYFSSVANTI